MLSFTHVEGELEAYDAEPLRGFAIAGEERKSFWAEAEIGLSR